MSESSKPYEIKVIQCPSCEDENASLISHLMDIPYYKDFVMVNISCRNCGFRSTDFYNLHSKGYTKFIYRVTSRSDDKTKIVRSQDGYVTIPELEITIEPFGEGSSWIRNIEGILEDIKKKLVIMLRDFDDKETRMNVKERMKELKRLKRYEKPFHIIVEDHTGNSLIIPADESKLEIIKE